MSKKDGRGGNDPLLNSQRDWIKMSDSTCKKQFTTADLCNSAPACIWKDGGSYVKQTGAKKIILTYPAHCTSSVPFPI